MLHQKEALICWLQKFVLSCTLINGELHQKMVKSSDKNTEIWCNIGRIFVICKPVLLFSATQVRAQVYLFVFIRIYIMTLVLKHWMEDITCSVKKYIITQKGKEVMQFMYFNVKYFEKKSIRKVNQLFESIGKVFAKTYNISKFTRKSRHEKI